MSEEDPLVTVRRRYDDWRMADYRLSEISGLHWHEISGGVNVRAPLSLIHGYVRCDRMEFGELSHSCRRGARPHRIKVCITKSGNEAEFGHVLAKLECGIVPPKKSGK